MQPLKHLPVGYMLLIPAMVLVSCVVTRAQKSNYSGIGRTATPDEIKVEDITIAPDGKGLPVGHGTAKEGAPVFAAKCSMCHGPTAEESKLTYARLVGGIGTLKTDDPVITPGSTWPYATSIWDFIHRAMPEFPAASYSLPEGYLITEHPVPIKNYAGGGGLGGNGGGGPFEMKDGDLLKTGVNPLVTVDQIYALTAFILWRNGIIKDDEVMNQETLPKVRMPNHDGFVPMNSDGKVPVWHSRDPNSRLEPHVAPSSKPLPAGAPPVNAAP